MRWVEQAVIRPQRCAAIPFIGNANARRGFIDTGSETWGGDHVYVSVEAVEEMARMIGWAPPLDQSRHERDRAAMQAEIDQVKAELADRDRKLAAVEVLKAGGFTAGRKPGRPAKQKQEVTRNG